MRSIEGGFWIDISGVEARCCSQTMGGERMRKQWWGASTLYQNAHCMTAVQCSRCHRSTSLARIENVRRLVIAHLMLCWCSAVLEKDSKERKKWCAERQHWLRAPVFKKNNTLFDSKRAARANKESTAGALAVHTVSMLQKCMTEKLVLDALKNIYPSLPRGR